MGSRRESEGGWRRKRARRRCVPADPGQLWPIADCLRTARRVNGITRSDSSVLSGAERQKWHFYAAFLGSFFFRVKEEQRSRQIFGSRTCWARQLWPSKGAQGNTN
ncbi:hypothetical protein L1887_43630 [Cichorium endivia]|nr:hypothetical protein L1887_43630 [Cichorium endivia]